MTARDYFDPKAGDWVGFVLRPMPYAGSVPGSMDLSFLYRVDAPWTTWIGNPREGVRFDTRREADEHIKERTRRARGQHRGGLRTAAAAAVYDRVREHNARCRAAQDAGEPAPVWQLAPVEAAAP